YLATARPRDGANRRFALWVFGSKGVIELRTGWLPPCFLLESPDWTGAEKGVAWRPITSAGVGRPEPIKDAGMGPANRRTVADLARAVETDTQPRATLYDARGALEMLLACHASHAKGGPVTLPLEERKKHPLDTL